LDVAHQIICCERADRNQVFVAHIDCGNAVRKSVIGSNSGCFFFFSAAVCCKGREGRRAAGREGGV
jgi:hypothetical protein